MFVCILVGNLSLIKYFCHISISNLNFFENNIAFNEVKIINDHKFCHEL